MKKKITLLLLLITGATYSQTSGIKISNSEPIIDTKTKKVAIERTLYNSQISESIQLNYLKGKRKPLDSILNKLKTELYQNSIGRQQDFFSDEQIITKSDSIKTFEKLLAINEKKQDSLYKKITGKEISTVYNTSEIVDYNYLSKDKEPLSKELFTLKTELYGNSIDETPNSRLHKDSITKKKIRIKTIEKEIGLINKKQDSLYHIYTKDYLQFKRVSFLSFGPKRSQAMFDFIYGDSGKRFQVLNNTGFTFGDNTGSIYSELVSGNLGIFRVSFGSMISSSSSEDNETAKEEEAFQRLATYGGNTVLTFEYPLAYIHSRNNQYNLISRFIAKGAADFPEFGTTTDDFAGSASFGLDIYADASLSNNSLRFFMNFNINGIYGTSTYQENLGIENSSFSFGQLTLGLIVAENIKLSFVLSSFSSEDTLDNRNVILGGQILH